MTMRRALWGIFLMLLLLPPQEDGSLPWSSAPAAAVPGPISGTGFGAPGVSPAAAVRSPIPLVRSTTSLVRPQPFSTPGSAASAGTVLVRSRLAASAPHSVTPYELAPGYDRLQVVRYHHQLCGDRE